MKGRVFSFVRSGNPLAQILSILVFAVLLAAALIMGAVVVAVMLGLGVIFATVLAVRVWWFRRKLRSAPPAESGYEPPPPGGGKAPQKRLIEGEYEVVKRSDADDKRRQR
ncbi:MAG: hypothetical protein ABI640_21650 [Gammaproteobacteria bacterium]